MDQKSVIQTNQFSTTLFSLMVMDPSKIIRFVKIFPMLNYAQVRIYQTLAFYAIMQYLIGHPRWPRDGRNDDPIAFCICRYIDLLTAYHIFSLRFGFSATKSFILGWPLGVDRSSTLSVFCCSQFIFLLVIIFVGKENGDKIKNILYLTILRRLKGHFKIFRNKKYDHF